MDVRGYLVTYAAKVRSYHDFNTVLTASPAQLAISINRRHEYAEVTYHFVSAIPLDLEAYEALREFYAEW